MLFYIFSAEHLFEPRNRGSGLSFSTRSTEIVDEDTFLFVELNLVPVQPSI